MPTPKKRKAVTDKRCNNGHPAVHMDRRYGWNMCRYFDGERGRFCGAKQRRATRRTTK
jgi:hypothetical protein